MQAAAAGGVVAAVRQGTGEQQEFLKCLLSLRENVELAALYETMQTNFFSKCGNSWRIFENIIKRKD